MGENLAIIIRPRVSNDATQFTFKWASQILDAFQNKDNIEIIDLQEDLAKRQQVESIFMGIGESIGIVVFYGHGCGCGMSLIGNDDKSIIDVLNNMNLRNKICYIIACNSAKILGPLSVEKGAISYLGFRYPFGFVPELEASFGQCANAGILKIIHSGCTIREAKHEIRAQLSRWEKIWMEEGRPFTAAVYRQNYRYGKQENLTVLGEDDARI